MSMSKLFSKASTSGSTGDPVTTSNWEKAFFDYINSGIMSSKTRSDIDVGFYEPFNDLNNGTYTNGIIENHCLKSYINEYLTSAFVTGAGTSIWTQNGTLPTDYAYGSSTIELDEYIYDIGGFCSGTPYQYVYKKSKTNFVTGVGDWEQCGDYKTSSDGSPYLAYTKAAVIGDYVYLFGGLHNNTATTTNISYLNYVLKKSIVDFKAGTGLWIITNIQLPLNYSYKYGLMVYDNNLYLFGGQLYSSTSGGYNIYVKSLDDIENNISGWTTFSSFAGSGFPSNLSSDMSVLYMAEKVYIFGGSYASNIYTKIYSKSITDFLNKTGTFVQCGSLWMGTKSPTIASGYSTIVIDSYCYLVGAYHQISGGYDVMNYVYKQFVGRTTETTTMTTILNNYTFTNKETCKCILKLKNNTTSTEKIILDNSAGNVKLSYSYDNGITWNSTYDFSYTMTDDIQYFTTEIDLTGKTSIKFKIETLDNGNIPDISIYDFSCICKDVV